MPPGGDRQASPDAQTGEHERDQVVRRGRFGGRTSNDALVSLILLLLGVASAVAGADTSGAGTNHLIHEYVKASETRAAENTSQEFVTTRPGPASTPSSGSSTSPRPARRAGSRWG